MKVKSVSVWSVELRKGNSERGASEDAVTVLSKVPWDSVTSVQCIRVC